MLIRRSQLLNNFSIARASNLQINWAPRNQVAIIFGAKIYWIISEFVPILDVVFLN